ncbi:MAG: hypothetical protein ACRDN9_19690 [Streptosporangiaceae bacterium]
MLASARIVWGLVASDGATRGGAGKAGGVGPVRGSGEGATSGSGGSGATPGCDADRLALEAVSLNAPEGWSEGNEDVRMTASGVTHVAD